MDVLSPEAWVGLTGLGASATRWAVSERRVVSLPLSERDELGADYHVLIFAAEQPIEAEAGHFAMVRGDSWGSAPLLPRPMSLLTAGTRPSILIKVVGEGTRRMALAAPGEHYTFHAPLGRPWPGAEGRRPVLVAGGVGVAPLLYLARQLQVQGCDNVLTLYGGRSARDLPLAEELAAAGELRCSTEDGSRGHKGLVTGLLEPLLDGCADRDGLVVYCCGPHGMMGAVSALAERAGVRCYASLEAPMGCGYGVCLGCPVARRDGSYLYTCVDGPCVDAGNIDWKVPVFG